MKKGILVLLIVLSMSIMASGCAVKDVVQSQGVSGRYVSVWDPEVFAIFDNGQFTFIEHGSGTTGTYKVMSSGGSGGRDVRITTGMGNIAIVNIDGNVMTDPDGDVMIKNIEKNLKHQEVDGKTYHLSFSDADYLSFQNGAYVYCRDLDKYAGRYTYLSANKISLVGSQRGGPCVVYVYEDKLRFEGVTFDWIAK
jgi:hypothetical protein